MSASQAGPTAQIPRSASIPPPSGGMGSSSQSGPPPVSNSGQGGAASQQNLNQIVIEYLNKKGYARTEATLRQEAANVDSQGRVIQPRAEDKGGKKYVIAFSLLCQWIDESLDIYKPELKRLGWPVFVYAFLGLTADYYADLAGEFFNENSTRFDSDHAEDVKNLANVRLPEHIEDNATARIYRRNKYRLSLSKAAYFTLVQFLESKESDGGSVILGILQNSMYIVILDRAAAGAEKSLAAILAKGDAEADIPDEDEGIPGHKPGSANTHRDAPHTLPRVSLGGLPLQAEQSADLKDDLEDEDLRNPPAPGQKSLIEELNEKIKREQSEEAPSRDNIPLPPPLARDVAMEVQKIKEYRDRFRIDPKSSGIGPGVSITMFTFHNSFDSINCLDFSGDDLLVAAGMAESYIRVWSLEGKPMPSLTPNSNEDGQSYSSSKRLIGHSGPVYAISFSPSISLDDPSVASTTCRYLLSCSADKTIRLWSLDTWSNLVVYKGHDHPIWDITWGPFGHYFVTGSHDNTARLWSTDHVSPLRIFAGHDKDVDCVCFHPNNAYVFTGSSDKTVRMWEVTKGSAVRLFTGHTANITSVACAPNGRILASADDAGAIILWDLRTGQRIKRMRGHARGGIWSLSWSVESSLLVSGGADQTVRVWDVLLQVDGPSGVRGETGTSKVDGTVTGATVSGVGPGKKAKAKDATITPDQISAFPTKKSPVYKVQFTQMNLVLAGGAYMP